MNATAISRPRRSGKPGAGRALSEGRRSERRLGLLLCAPAALVMVAVTGWPILYSMWLSLQRYDLKFPQRSEFIGLENYIAVLGSGFWWRAFVVTLLITVVSVAVEFVLGMALALVMHRTILARDTVRAAAPRAAAEAGGGMGGRDELVVRLSAESAVRGGGHARFWVDTRHVQLFDPDGGGSITP